MPLKKTIRIASIGVPASHHVIRHITLDYAMNAAAVAVASFYDAEAAVEGAQSIGMATVNLESMPAAGDDPLAFCERHLVAEKPADAPNATLNGNPNRYVFAGAEIVA